MFLRAPGLTVDYKKAVNLPKNMRPAPTNQLQPINHKAFANDRYVLAYPALAAESMRQIASATGTSPGYVQRTCACLRNLVSCVSGRGCDISGNR